MSSPISSYFAQQYGSQAPWVQESYEKHRREEARDRKAFAHVDPSSLFRPADIKAFRAAEKERKILAPIHKIQKKPNSPQKFHSPLMQKIYKEHIASRDHH